MAAAMVRKQQRRGRVERAARVAAVVARRVVRPGKAAEAMAERPEPVEWVGLPGPVEWPERAVRAG